MTTETMETTTTPEFEIVALKTVHGGTEYQVWKDLMPLTDAYGRPRYFKTRNSARKRISRERRGNYHR